MGEQQPHPNGGDTRPIEGIAKKSNPVPTRQRGSLAQHTPLEIPTSKMPGRQNGKPGMEPRIR